MSTSNSTSSSAATLHRIAPVSLEALYNKVMTGNPGTIFGYENQFLHALAAEEIHNNGTLGVSLTAEQLAALKAKKDQLKTFLATLDGRRSSVGNEIVSGLYSQGFRDRVTRLAKRLMSTMSSPVNQYLSEWVINFDENINTGGKRGRKTKSKKSKKAKKTKKSKSKKTKSKVRKH